MSTSIQNTTQLYIGLTIGPMYRTFHPLRRTRSIFACSYLFSYLMRQLLKTLTSNPDSLQGKILIPYVPDNETERATYLTGGKGIGLFPDRLLIQATEGDYKRLQTACDTVLKALSAKLGLSIDFIGQYIQLYGLSVMLPRNAETINELNRLLDNMELRNQFVNGPDPNTLTTYLANPKLDRTDDPLMHDAFGEKTAFPSLADIALRGLRKLDAGKYQKAMEAWQKAELSKNDKQDDNQDDDGRLMKAMKVRFDNDFRQYHRYIAIVEADGDRMGIQIGNTGGDPEQLGVFSKKLYEFGQEAKKAIENYGGSPVYIGGDDLLFFAPVAVPGDTPGSLKTIFDCVAELDEAFHGIFPKVHDGPTMSYGISMSYYKFPLNEAREVAHDLLMDKAKKHQAKNAVEFKLLKHSGSFFEAGFDKGDPYYVTLMELLHTNLAGETWLNSVIYFVQHHQHLIAHLCLGELKNLFQNQFNKDIHTQHREFLHNQLPQLIHAVYQHFTPKPTPINEQDKKTCQGQTSSATAQLEQAQKTIVGLLRFTQFIRSVGKDD